MKSMAAIVDIRNANYETERMRMLSTMTSTEMLPPLKSIQHVLEMAYKRATNEYQVHKLEAGLRATKILLCRVNDLVDLAVIEKKGFRTAFAEFNIMDAIT